jgi:hypothetical protein
MSDAMGNDAPETNEQESQPQSTDDLLRAVLQEQQAHRAEVAQLREELAKQKTPVQQSVSSRPATAEELYEQRMADINEHEFYCPGCGKLGDYPQKCTGRGEAPHPPIEMVSTDELKGDDPSKHTAAPATTTLG